MSAKSGPERLPALPPRRRFWLLRAPDFRVRLLAALLLGFASLFVLAFTTVLAAIRFYRVTAASSIGFDWMEFLQTAAYGLAALAALSGLGIAFWLLFRLHGEHAARLERDTAFTRSLVEASPDAILTLEMNGLIQWCNPATEMMFGYEPGRLKGQGIARLIPQRNFLHDVATLGRGTFMAFGQRQNFVTFPAEVSVAEVANPGRRTFVVSIHDASERRHSQETVHHISLGVSSLTGEAFVRTLLQQLSQVLQNDFAFVLEADARPGTGICSLMLAERGRIRSKSDHNLAGTAFEEALANGFAAYPRAAREACPHDAILQSLEAESFVGTTLCDVGGGTVGLIGVISRAPMENVGVARQTLQLFATRAAAEIARKQEAEVLASEKARLHGDYTAMRDTAERERKRYEEDIAAEQEMLTVTLRSIREGCITTDNDGRVMMVNPVAEDLTGWTQPEAADRPLGEVLSLLSARRRRPVEESLLLDRPEQLGASMILVSREGTERIVELSAAPIRNRQERKLGTVLVLRDITEKSRAEEERQKAEKLESLGLAAGGIAHDFNNLLTAIIGNLSLALAQAKEESKAGSGVRERVEASKKASLRAQDLAQQLLTFAKGGAPIKKTASMRQLVLDTVGFSLSGTNIRSEFSIPEDLWPVEIDAGQISQVISNLAVNAVQAMANGGMLHVTGKNLEVGEQGAPPTLRPGRYVRITVRDDGPGIPEEIQKKIFDPYFTTKPKGSGLGLATSYSIVKNHGGLIQLASNPSEGGATFIIHLPASEGEVVPETEAPVVRLTRQGNILVLDDEEVICELVAYALTPLGYTVEQAYNAETALRMYREAMERGKPFDVVIMDLTIPGGMGGKEAVVKLREIDPKAKAVVSSGYAMDPIMSRFRDYGFAGVIAKPYDITELEQVVGSLIAESAEDAESANGTDNTGA